DRICWGMRPRPVSSASTGRFRQQVRHPGEIYPTAGEARQGTAGGGPHHSSFHLTEIEREGMCGIGEHSGPFRMEYDDCIATRPRGASFDSHLCRWSAVTV